MKYKLLSLMFLVINFFACAQPTRSVGDKFGGLLIVYNDTTSTTSCLLLGTNIEIKPLNDKIAILNKIRPGVYSLLVKDKTKEIITHLTQRDRKAINF